MPPPPAKKYMLGVRPVLLALLFGTLVTLLPAFAPATDTQSRTVPLPPGRVLSVEITIGAIKVEGSTRTDAAIDVVRHAPTPEGLARIPVEIVEDEKEIRIRGIQAESGTDAAYRTDVTLKVPHAAVIGSIKVLEGRVSLQSLDGAVTADIRRGPIDAVGLAGTMRLETGIGNVTADRMRLSADGLLRLRAFNGNVTLTLAERPRDARILALALNGTIASAIPLNRKDTWGPRWSEATLGAGEPVISIDVVTGRIEIKAPSK